MINGHLYVYSPLEAYALYLYGHMSIGVCSMEMRRCNTENKHTTTVTVQWNYYSPP